MKGVAMRAWAIQALLNDRKSAMRHVIKSQPVQAGK